MIVHRRLSPVSQDPQDHVNFGAKPITLSPVKFCLILDKVIREQDVLNHKNCGGLDILQSSSSYLCLI